MNQQYNAIKIIVIVLLVVAAGAFIYTRYNSGNANSNNTGMVINPVNPIAFNPSQSPSETYDNGDGTCTDISGPTSDRTWVIKHGVMEKGICIILEDELGQVNSILTINKLTSSLTFSNGHVNVTGSPILQDQVTLAVLGYLKNETILTGTLDTNTVAALKAYQQAKGLPANGQFTTTTQTSLSSALTAMTFTAQTSTPTTSAQ